MLTVMHIGTHLSCKKLSTSKKCQIKLFFLQLHMFIVDDDVTDTVVEKPNNNTEEAREAQN